MTKAIAGGNSVRHTVEARADRWQRRHTGPWRTVERQAGPVILTTRYRRRPRIEYVRLWVASHDLQRAIEREVLLPVLRWLARWLPS